MNEEKVKISAKDKLIIYELEKDCRRPLGEIASAVGISKQALHYRIERLVGLGVIKSFLAFINVAKLGLVNHEVWLELKSLKPEKKNRLIGYLVKHKSVRLVVECSGSFDLLVGILAKNVVEYDRIFREIVKNHPGTIKRHFTSFSSEFITYPRTHFAGKGERKTPLAIRGDPVEVGLDSTDKRILESIANNARISTVELAKKARVSPITVRQRLKRLEKIGVIGGYKIFFEHKAIGYENCEILAKLQNMDEKREAELEEYCRQHPYSTYLLKCIGRWDIDVGFDAKSAEHFREIIADFRDRFSDILVDYQYVATTNWHKFTYYPF